jgi:hypothetical protein
MHFHHFHQGSCHLHLFAPDLALFALAFRKATESNDLMLLNPLMSITLDSLAAAFEGALLLGLQQTGMVDDLARTEITAERLRRLCVEVVSHGGVLPEARRNNPPAEPLVPQVAPDPVAGGVA